MQSKQFTDWAVKLHTKTAQAGGAVIIDGIVECGLAPNLRTLTEGGDGCLYHTYGSFVGGAPVLGFTTLDLKAFLDECALTGMLVDADGSHPGVVAYWQRMAHGGGRGGASVHASTTFGDGILVPRSIQLSHGGNARLSAELAATSSDGSTAPMTYAGTASLDAGTYPAAGAAWTLGKVNLNGTELAGLRSVEIQCGVTLDVEGGDGDQWPTFASIRRIQPTVTATGRHVDITSTVTESGVYYTAEQVTVYARKRSEGGGYVADGTAEHIKFTLGKCRVETGPIGGDPKDGQVIITPWYTAGEADVLPIAIDTAAAYA